jgi:amino acid adenylation domain-containing protein
VDYRQKLELQQTAKANGRLEKREEFPMGDIEKSIPEHFENIVRKYPDRLAAKMRNCTLTYDQLNRAANRISRNILGNRGKESEPVALLFERGIDAIAAILGILKTGKFYVALDPTFPAQRNAYILNDSQANLIVTNNRNLALANELATHGYNVLNIDEIDNGLMSDNLDIFVAPRSPMNIGYTSGSTGNPKGVVKIHRNSAASAFRIPVRPDDRLSLVHSLSFGSANANLFSSLLNGGSLFPFDIKSEGIPRLANWLVEEQITICHLSPALFRELADFLSTKEMASSLRFIRLSGAPITRQDFELYKKNFSPRTLLSIEMSSTEAGGSFSATVDRTFDFPEEGTPLGFPLSGKTVLLLDDDGREVEANQVGEIAIKGRIHAGYWRKPDLTSAKFLTDPSGGEERICLTGDLGRMLPDGFMIHLGRKDLMVKIRGYRVEIEEVERTLVEHMQVKAAGVKAWDRDNGDKYLAAYIVKGNDCELRVEEVQSYLRKTLPDYMIPSVIVFLESLPLANGKLDRKALPKPDHRRPELRTEYVEAANAIEVRLVAIWQQVLDVHPVGIDDNFFDLGGHSVVAAQLFTRIDDEFGRLLPLSVLVKSPTIRSMAKYLDSVAEPAHISALVPFTQAGNQSAIFAVPGVYGNVVGLFDLCRELGKDRAFYGLQSIGLDGQEAAIDRVELMAKRYLAEVRTVQPHGPYILLGACFGARVTCEMAYQLLEAGEAIDFLAFLDPIGLVRSQRRGLSEVTTTNNNEPSKFLNNRVRLYCEEMRHLDTYDRVRFLTRKVRSLGRTLITKKARRALQREIHQTAVFNASKVAGQRYQPKSLKGPLRALEIFVSEHPRKNELKDFDWRKVWDGKPLLHQVPGRDSGDMLSGENAKVLGALLRERLLRQT